MNPDAPDPASNITHTSWMYVFGPRGRTEDFLANIAAANLNISAMAGGFERLAKEATRGS